MDNTGSRARAGRPATLSREHIVRAALETGPNYLTVRGLAKRLGVTHSALYRWVRNREDLLDLVSDTLLSNVCARMADSRTEDWRQWLIELADAVRRDILPHLSHRIVTQFPRDTVQFQSLRSEAVTRMRNQGVADAVAHESFDIYLLTTWGWLIAEGTCTDDVDYAAQYGTMCRALAHGLPARPLEGSIETV